jgi:hypothetical protein
LNCQNRTWISHSKEREKGKKKERKPKSQLLYAGMHASKACVSGSHGLTIICTHKENYLNGRADLLHRK